MTSNDRYSRQIVLPEVGPRGQARLRAASALVVGAGGLGSPVLSYLCSAGVGRLIIVDYDRVEESNLHRQPLYRTRDCGTLKVDAAAAALKELNPEVVIETMASRVTPANVAGLVRSCDAAVDAADSLALTYILSDECRRLAKPLISASVLGLTGYVGAFCACAPSYRAVFPDMPRQAGSCAQAGVLGTAVAVMGTLQADLTAAVLLGLEPTVLGRLITVDLRTLRFGGFAFDTAAEPPADRALTFIAPEQVSSADVVIDLRAVSEAPASPFETALRIGVDEIESNDIGLPRDRRVVVCCRSGVRAWRAARALERRGHRELALVALGE